MEQVSQQSPFGKQPKLSNPLQMYRGQQNKKSNVTIHKASQLKHAIRFLTTPRGARFIAQQALLQSQNPDRRKNIITKIGDDEVRTQTTDQNSRLYNPGAPILAKALSQEFTSQKPKRHIDLSRFGDPVESRTENATKPG